MEEFLLQNIERFEWLLTRFQPTPEAKAVVETRPNPDMIVSTRIRPLSEEEEEQGWVKALFPRANKPGLVDVHELKRAVRGKPTLKSAHYNVDRTYDDKSTTEEIYKDLVEQLVTWAWGGGIGTLFAYGQTGSGKTHTVSGLEELAFKALMSGQLEGDRNIYLSIVELAGNSAQDLLNARKQISVLEDSFGVTQLAGALEPLVTSYDEVLGYIEKAAAFRRTESTDKNDSSSRSHAICRIRFEIPSLPDADDGLLYLIDLSGSEAARDRAKHGADRMRETREINISLSVLKDCIRGKAESDALVGTTSKVVKHVPFRQSALTKILKHVFDPAGGRLCKTVVIASVNPSLIDIPASRNTLRFAEMLRVALPKEKELKFDQKVPMTWSNEQLRAWIDTESGTPPVSSKLLAPSETGRQLLRLPAPEFDSRCLKTPGVLIEEVKAFRSKLWRMHIDSQRRPAKAESAAESSGPDTILAHLSMFERKSSRDLDPEAASIPFKERIRPGMVIRWTPPRYHRMGSAGSAQKINLAVILCSTDAVGSHVKDTWGDKVNSAKTEGEADEKKKVSHLCMIVKPSPLPDAYEMDLWRHIVIEEDLMDAEVILEYEEGSRHYYIAV